MSHTSCECGFRFQWRWSMIKREHSSWWSGIYHSLLGIPAPIHGALELALDSDAVAKWLGKLESPSYGTSCPPSRNPPLCPFFEPEFPLDISRYSPPCSECARKSAIASSSFVRLLTSDHPSLIELGQRQSLPIPRHRRICRFCCQ